MSEELNYKDLISIDEDSLDLEWLDQSDRMMQVSSLVSDLQYEMDIAADNIELVFSELDLKIRKNPNKYIDLPEDMKITEAVIKATILKQKAYQDARKHYLQTRKEYQDARGAVNAFEHRKAALQNLVTLHGQRYFAGPKVPRDIAKERENRKEKDKDRNRRIGSKLKRTKLKRRKQ